MSFPRTVATAVLLATGAVDVGAQQTGCRAAVLPIDLVRDPSHRLLELRRPPESARDLQRDAVWCAPDDAPDSAAPHFKIRASRPDLRLEWNGTLPDARANGGMWAGRGTTVLARLGVLVDRGAFHMALVPEAWHAENRGFEFIPSTAPGRSSYASPFYADAVASLDLPSRFGSEPITQLALGQSALWFRIGKVAAGLSSSNQLWGPGRDGLVLGSSAAGVPRVFARTESPLLTRAGRWSLSAFYGRLGESRFFDLDATNDERSLTGLSVVWSPPGSDDLALGLSRAAITPLDQHPYILDGMSLLGSSDQLTSAFVRLSRPDSRLRAWMEVAVQGKEPFRVRYTAPMANLGYRVGVERAFEQRSGAWLFLAEAANVEQSWDVMDMSPHDFYSGYASPAGWTQRGMLLGDEVGPGGQSQYLSGDWVARRWRAGAFVERWRQNEDALFRQYLANFARHDVSLRGGVRAGVSLGDYDFAAELSSGRRLNYLFQNATFQPMYRTVDVALPQVKLIVTPARLLHR